MTIAPPPLANLFALFAFALATTLALELPTAALFGVGKRGLGAVVLANLVTNPLFNLVFVLIVFLLGLNAWTYLASLPVAVVLEIAVVIAEWRLLVWALRTTGGSSMKLLAMSVTMNLVSGLVGTLLVTVFFTPLALVFRFF